MSFNRPTLSDLTTRITSDFDTRLPGADSRLRYSVLNVLARAMAGTAMGIYGNLEWLANQFIIDTAEAEYLSRWADIWEVPRRAAQGARGDVTLTGNDGAVIAAGTLMSGSGGQSYRTIAATNIINGTAIARVEAEDSGAITNQSAGAAFVLDSAISGVNAAVSVAANGLIGGIEEESDNSLRARLLARIRTPPQGGALNDYVQWALQVPGVTRAWSYDQWLGAGTVGLTFVFDDRDDIVPTEDDLAVMQAHIDPLRPAGMRGLTIFAPVQQPVPVRVRLVPDTPDVRAAVTAELRDMFARDAAPGMPVRVSRIGQSISLAAGESFHDLELPQRDPQAAAGQLLMLGDVQWV